MTTRRWVIGVAMGSYAIGFSILGLSLAWMIWGFIWIALCAAPGGLAISPENAVLTLVGLGWIVAASATVVAARTDRPIDPVRPIPPKRGLWRRLLLIFATTSTVSVTLVTVGFGICVWRAVGFHRKAESHMEALVPYSPKSHPELEEDPRSMRKYNYHSLMYEKYRDAAAKPWLRVPPDPPPE